MIRSVIIAICAAAMGLSFLGGCQTEPVTGRRQLMLIGPNQEMELGAQAYQEVLKEAKISTDAQATAILQRVGQRVAAAADQPDFQWEFTLIDSPEANAFCLPGGKVAVYTGILPICRNEAGLAAVVGHEIGHAIAHHGAERMSQSMLVQLGAEALQAGAGSWSPGAQGALLMAYGAGATVGYQLPFSRKQERSADEIGLELMAKAGYHPSEAVSLWERMAAQEQGGRISFLSTHPAPKDRIAEIKDQLPRVEQIYQQAPDKIGRGETLSASTSQ